MRFDLMNRLAPARAIAPVSVADNTAQVSTVYDSRGMMGIALILAIGAVVDVDATFTVLMEESDASGSGFTAVADADLIGTEALAGFAFDDDNELRKIGYKGAKRYLRATVTPVANASAALIAAIWIGCPEDQPAANPPV